MSDPLTSERPRPVRPRHAASLLLLRRTAAGPEVLMGRRPARSAFAPSVFVFPGGKVDAADFAVRPSAPLAEICARRTAAPARLTTALAVAALRETTEETGLTLGDPLRPDLSVLTLAARAITPASSPIRFHARFFTADATQATGVLGETAELSDLAFISVAEALATLPLMDVTEAVLEHLQVNSPQPLLFTYRGGRGRRTLIS